MTRLMLLTLVLAETHPVPWPWSDARGVAGQCLVSQGSNTDPDWFACTSGLTIPATGTCSSNQYATALSTSALTCSQPGFSNLSGSIAAAQLPAPTASAKGGVSGTGSSLTCASGNWSNGFTAGGALSCTAPALAATASTPTRTIGTAFTPSSTSPTLVTYSISIACTATGLTGSASGTVELRSDSAATPTTVRATAANSISTSLAISLTLNDGQTSSLSYLVPATHKVLLANPVASGCTASIVSQSEVALAIN